MTSIAKSAKAGGTFPAARTDPIMKKSTRFWDKVAEKYARQPVADEAAYEHKLAVTRDYLKPDMTVLEIGCGTGTTALKHSPYVKHIRATDFSESMITIAREKARAAGVDNVSFECVGIEDITEADETYDVVMAHSILHLLEDRDAVIAQVRRWLKPGGVFVSSTVCLGDRMGWFRLIAPVGRALGFFPLVRVFTGDNLIRAIRDAGFHIDYEWRPEKGLAQFLVAKKTL